MWRGVGHPPLASDKIHFMHRQGGGLDRPPVLNKVPSHNFSNSCQLQDGLTPNELVRECVDRGRASWVSNRAQSAPWPHLHRHAPRHHAHTLKYGDPNTVIIPSVPTQFFLKWLASVRIREHTANKHATHNPSSSCQPHGSQSAPRGTFSPMVHFTNRDPLHNQYQNKRTRHQNHYNGVRTINKDAKHNSSSGCQLEGRFPQWTMVHKVLHGSQSAPWFTFSPMVNFFSSRVFCPVGLVAFNGFPPGGRAPPPPINTDTKHISNKGHQPAVSLSDSQPGVDSPAGQTLPLLPLLLLALFLTPARHHRTLLTLLGPALLPVAHGCQECPGVPFLQPAHMATATAALLSFATINVHGSLFADASSTLSDIADAMRRHDIHAVCVTEANKPTLIHHAASHHAKEKRMIKQLYISHSIKVISATSPTKAGHTAILLHANLAQYFPPDASPLIDVDGRFLQVDLHFKPRELLSITCVYGDACAETKTATQTRLVDAMASSLDSHPPAITAHTIIQGDFNEVLHSQDTTNPQRALDDDGLLEWLHNDPRMVDLFRLHHPEVPAFTFTNTSSAPGCSSRLDYIFASTSLLPADQHAGALIDECGSLLAIASQDHRAVLAQIPHPLPNPTAPHPTAAPPPLDTLDFTSLAPEQWANYHTALDELLSPDLLSRLDSLIEDVQAADADAAVDRDPAFTVMTEVYNDLVTACMTAANSTLLPAALADTPSPPPSAGESPPAQHPPPSTQPSRPRRPRKARASTAMLPSTQESDLAKFSRKISGFSTSLSLLRNITESAFTTSSRADTTRNYLHRRFRAPTSSVHYPALSRPPHPAAPYHDWKRWATSTQALIDKAQRLRQTLTAARAAAARTEHYARRVAHAACDATYRSVRYWSARKTPPPVGLHTTWTTENDFSPTTPSCHEVGCDISRAACTRCAAPAYVTSDHGVLRRQAAAAFREKLRKRKPITPSLTRTAINKYNETITHLTDSPPAADTLPHPSHRSIHALLHPNATPAETKHHYKHIMRPPTFEEFLIFLKKQRGSSAPGPSKFRYCLLLHGTLLAQKLLHRITCLNLLLEGLPTSLKHAHLYPIPKKDGLLIFSRMRPISLLEIGYKLTTGWLAYTIREHAATAPHPLWHTSQYGATGGTHDALLRFLAAIEDAQSRPTSSIFACLADVEAAYDSVSPESKSITYRRAGLPEAFINLAFNLDSDATTSVLLAGTDPADPFQVESGFRQGDPLSVIGWLLFINPLIEWLDQGTPQATTPHPHAFSYSPVATSAQGRLNGTHRRDDAAPVSGDYPLTHGGGTTSPLFYMDDASFLATHRRGITTHLERFSLYLSFHDVNTHPKKTILTSRVQGANPIAAHPPAVFTHGAWTPVTYVPPTTPLCYLGVHFQIQGSWRHQHRALRSNTSLLLSATHNHNASLSEARYYVSSTVQASALYRTALVPLTPSDLALLDSKCVRTLNRSANLPVNAPYWRWGAPPEAGGAGYEPISIKTLDTQLTLLALWLTDPKRGPEYLAIKARLTAHGLAHGLPYSPLFLSPDSRPPPLPSLHPLTLCEAIYQHCRLHGVVLTTPYPLPLPPRITTAQPQGDEPLFIDLLHLFPDICDSSLRRLAGGFHLIYVADLLTPNTTRFASAARLWERTGRPVPPPPCVASSIDCTTRW